MEKHFNIRALRVDDWQIFRDVRLKALKETPSVFGSSWEKENTYDDSWWQNVLKNEQHKIFGLFNNETLVGLNAVFTSHKDPSGKTASLAMWYLDKDYRGKGLFHNLVMAGIDWAKQQERFDRIIVSHREGNEASRKANERAGFKYTHKGLHTFGDGIEDYEHISELRITR